MQDPVQPNFPLWVRITQALNFLFMILLWRRGIAIIGAHPAQASERPIRDSDVAVVQNRHTLRSRP
jgi:hypothetical protein